MPLLLTEADVKAILTMPLALEVVETSFRRLAEGKAVLQYRQRLHVPGKGVLNHMAAADLTTGYMGLKIYSISRGGARFLVTLFSAESGDLVALIEADYLGQMRTGAASGVATRFMARAGRSRCLDHRNGPAVPHATGSNRRSPETGWHSRLWPRSRKARDVRKRDVAALRRSGHARLLRGGGRSGRPDRDHLHHLQGARPRRPLDRAGNAHQCGRSESAAKARVGCRSSPSLRRHCGRFARAVENRVRRFDSGFCRRRKSVGNPFGSFRTSSQEKFRGAPTPLRSPFSNRMESPRKTS